LNRLAIVPRDGSSGILAQIAGAVGPLLEGSGLRPEDLGAVGIGFGGPVDAERGIITTSHQVPGWDGFPLADWVGRELGVSRVSVQNDADTAALGEARFGAGVGLSPVLYVTIGSGIGGGLIVDGRIYRGSGSGALEIGHLWIHDPGDHDHQAVKLENLASGWAIGLEGRHAVDQALKDGWDSTRMIRLSGGDSLKVTAAVVAEAAALGDSQAGAILRRAAGAMARGLAHAVTLLGPRRIILGGGVSLAREDLWLDPIRAELDRLAFPPFRGTYDVVSAALGEEVVVQGALALALARDAASAQ
jgi:glucokinase